MTDELTGPNQAQAMLHRVSPEGRARALREQRRRRQRAMRWVVRALIALVAVGLTLLVSRALFGSIPAGAIGGAVGAVIAVFWVMASRRRHPTPQALESAPLAALPPTAAEWLEEQCAQLPAPARSLGDALAAEIAGLRPQVTRLPEGEPAGEAVRRLLAVELPALVERYRSIPEPLRARPREGGRSADSHLLEGLGIVREEVARMSEQLAGGQFDALATQNRFLELKYQGEAMLALPTPATNPPP